MHFDYRDDEKRQYIGIYHTINNQILTNIALYVPFIDCDKTLIINIHEYLHAIILYNKLGTEFKLDIDCEIIPMLYEQVYIRENPNSYLERYLNYLDSSITKDSPLSYRLALELRKELIKYYEKNNPTLPKLERKVKRLVNKHTKKKC